MNSKNTPTPTTRVFRRHADISFTQLGGQGLLVIPNGAQQVVLNEQGLRVLELVDGERTVADIAAVLAGEYEAELTLVEKDVSDLLDDLAGRGAVHSDED